MQENGERLGVGGQHDQISNATIERLGGFVGALLELLVVVGLLHQVQDGRRQLGVGQGEGLGVARRLTSWT